MTKATSDISPKVKLEQLETLYRTYNKREYVHPDPLEFLYNYENPADREVVGLIASSLAYGSVWQILKAVQTVLDRMPVPAEFVAGTSKSRLIKIFSDFKYRFNTGEDISALLYGIGRVIKKHGSLEKCFKSGITNGDDSVISGLGTLVDEIVLGSGGGDKCFYQLLPHPSRKSACKRLNLYLRWMVRRDDVDPGGWYTVGSEKLLVPIDVHMFRICRALGLTARGNADLRTSMEITGNFRKINPADPVKYDFAITRLGIRDELEPDVFIKECLETGGEDKCKNTKD